MQMFDPSKYVPDLAGSAMQGNELMVRSAMANTQNMGRDFANMNDALAQKRRDKMQLQAAMAQLAERQAARQSLEQRFGERLGMQRQNAATAQGNVMYERDQKQRATDADLVSGLVGPMASGNLNALEQARAQAVARDPSLSVQLPGERAAAVPDTDTSMTFTPDEVYPEDVNKVRVSRGDTRLYTSPEDRVMRGREAAIADLLGPNSGPWMARSAEAAGAGVTGVESSRIGREQQGRLDANQAARDVAGARMGQQRDMATAAAEREEPWKLHDRLKAIVAEPALQDQKKKITNGDRMYEMAESQLAQGANPFMQNEALATLLREQTGLSSTDAERRAKAQQTGMWGFFDKELSKWLDGAEVPAEYRQQVLEMLRSARAQNRKELHGLGAGARDRVYASGLPFASARDMARAGAMGGGLPSGGLPDDAFIPPNDMGDMGGFAGGSGARDALPVVPGKPPSLPLQPPAQDPIDSELDAEALRLLEAY